MSTIVTKSAELTYSNAGILRIYLFENSEIDITESKEMQKVSLQLTEGEKFVALIDARSNVVVSKESREWGSTPEAQINMLAQAIMVNSLANTIMGNFIIRFHKPPAKTRLFNNEDAALEWLKEQKIVFGLEKSLASLSHNK